MLELGNPREEGESLTAVQSQGYADGRRSDREPSPEAGSKVAPCKASSLLC